MFVSLVNPVAMRSVVFCMVWNLFVFMSDRLGDHMVLPHSSVVLVLAVMCLAIFSLT